MGGGVDIARAFEDSHHDRQRTTDELYDELLRVVYESCERHIPKKKKLTRIIPRDRRVLMRRRSRLQKQALRASETRKRKIAGQVEEIKKSLKALVDTKLEREEGRAVATVKRNTKYFFSYARKKTKAVSSVGPLEVDGKVLSEPREMARALQDHYEEVYTVPRFLDVEQAVDAWSGPDTECVLEDVELSEAGIIEAASRMAEHSAAGPNGVSAILIKKCISSLARPLENMWRVSLETGRVPGRLKYGVVTPIFKGGEKGECGSYRPVVLTSHFAKIFERVVSDQLTHHLEAGNLLGQNQHGFRKGRSCASQLIQHHHTIATKNTGGGTGR